MKNIALKPKNGGDKVNDKEYQRLYQRRLRQDKKSFNVLIEKKLIEELEEVLKVKKISKSEWLKACIHHYLNNLK